MNGPVPISSNSIVQLRTDLLAADVDGDVILMAVQQGIFYGLGGVGNAIWSRLSEPVRICDLRDSLGKRFDAPADVIEADLIRFMTDLFRTGFIDVRS